MNSEYEQSKAGLGVERDPDSRLGGLGRVGLGSCCDIRVAPSQLAYGMGKRARELLLESTEARRP